MVVAFLIWSACAAIFLAVGLYVRRAKKPVQFFTSGAPDVRNAKRHNRALSRIWFTGAVIFELLGLPFLFTRQNSPLFLVTVLGSVFLCIGMAIAARLLELRGEGKEDGED